MKKNTYSGKRYPSIKTYDYSRVKCCISSIPTNTAMPLPCGKTLWQAQDRTSRNAEYQKILSASTQRGGSEFKDLLPDFGSMNEESELRRMSQSSWFAEMDDFGTLITMTVSAL